MNKDRIAKLESIAKELVTKFIFEELEDYEKNFWIITITWTKISSDLSYLDIFVSSLINMETLPKTLAKHNYKIQKKFNKNVEIRKLPKIRFRYDYKWKISGDILQTINSLKNKKSKYLNIW